MSPRYFLGEDLTVPFNYSLAIAFQALLQRDVVPADSERNAASKDSVIIHRTTGEAETRTVRFRQDLVRQHAYQSNSKRGGDGGLAVLTASPGTNGH
jgi:hypothetical protein